VLGRVNGHYAERLETGNLQESDAKLKGERFIYQAVNVLTCNHGGLGANESGAV
jgi:hypothetical protein